MKQVGSLYIQTALEMSSEEFIFVVYNCAGEWDNYKDYTAAATKPNDLKFEQDKVMERKDAIEWWKKLDSTLQFDLAYKYFPHMPYAICRSIGIIING